MKNLIVKRHFSNKLNERILHVLTITHIHRVKFGAVSLRMNSNLFDWFFLESYCSKTKKSKIFYRVCLFFDKIQLLSKR